MNNKNTAPLQGLRVVDMSRALAGPYVTMLLADLGADVIKVEPLNGDFTRSQGPYHPDDKLHAYGGYFASVNRNKQSIACDLKTSEGQQIVRDLVTNSEVLVENFRPGVMEGMNLGFESLIELNPRLVYGVLRGFGDPRTGDSPYANRPAFDVVAQAMGGIMSITGEPDGPPTKVGPGVGDIFPAALTAVGILAALRRADATGVGEFVDVAMYDSIISLCERTVYQHSYLGVVPGREGNDHPIFCPFGIYKARDGWFSIAAPMDRQWAALCKAIGREDLAVDPDFSTNAGRSARCEEVRGYIESWSKQHTVAEVEEALSHQVPVAPVNTVDRIFDDPHVAAREMLVELEQPGVDEGLALAGQPIKFASGNAAGMRRAPLLGESTNSVLEALGYSADHVEELRGQGTVK